MRFCRYVSRKGRPQASCESLKKEKCSGLRRRRNSRQKIQASRHPCHSSGKRLLWISLVGYNAKEGSEPGIPGTSSILALVVIICLENGALLAHSSAE